MTSSKTIQKVASRTPSPENKKREPSHHVHFDGPGLKGLAGLRPLSFQSSRNEPQPVEMRVLGDTDTKAGDAKGGDTKVGDTRSLPFAGDSPTGLSGWHALIS